MIWLMVIRFDCFGKRISFDFSSRPIRKGFAVGYTNRCKDGSYIATLDYDNLRLDWIKPELKRLQKDFNLGSFYIFQSSKSSYHCVCIDKLSFHEFIHILRNSTVDPNYVLVPLKFGKKLWTLRTTPKKNKIKYIGYITGESTRMKSLAHGLFLEKIFNIHVTEKDQIRTDWDNELVLARYPQ